MATYAGGCHCGNVRVAFTTDLAPETMARRACTCSFCRRHATEALSDPNGRLEFRAPDAAALNRYRFGLGVTEFLVCRTCGVYVGALMPDDEGAWANVMARVLDGAAAFTAPVEDVARSEESVEEKRNRRRRMWTPATLVIETP